METERASVVKELIENEKLFNKQMCYIYNIMTTNRVPVPIDPSDLAALKLNLDEYINASGQIIEAYERAVAEAPNRNLALACVGKHLLPVTAAFEKALVTYIKDFDPQILTRRPHLKNYFQKAGELIRASDNSLSSLEDRLLKPFQRPFHIMCILERLKKSTPADHPDHCGVKEVIVAIQKACDNAESCKRKNGEYDRTDDFFRVPTEPGTGNNIAAGGFENYRMTFYRKKRTKVCLLIDTLCTWIEARSKELKSFVGDRRLLIKTTYNLLDSMESAKIVPPSLEFNSLSAKHHIINFSEKTFDAATETVLRQLQNLNQPLKKLKWPLRKLKNRAKDIAKKKPSKASAREVIFQYRRDERRALLLMEGVMNRSEAVIKALYLYYLGQVQNLFQYATIRNTGIVSRYADKSLPLREADITQHMRKNTTIFLMHVPQSKPREFQRTFQNSNPFKANGALPVIGRAIITFPHFDKQAALNLKEGDVVDVIKWGDDIGNTEWAFIRYHSRELFYPSNRLKLLW